MRASSKGDIYVLYQRFVGKAYTIGRIQFNIIKILTFIINLTYIYSLYLFY